MLCDFCRQRDDLKKRMIYEDDLVFAFLTHTPITEGHTLITPQRCVASVQDLTAQEIQNMFFVVEKIKSAMRRICNAHGFNHAWNEGEEAGQTVPHFHLHIIPRTIGDNGIYQYDPRKYLYRPGTRKVASNTSLNKYAHALSHAMK
jgi:histidine triad (HIT) family protein